MIIGAKVLLRQLDHYKILEKAFATYPNYGLTLTGKYFPYLILRFIIYIVKN